MIAICSILGIILGILLGYYGRVLLRKLDEIKSILLKEEEGTVAQTRSVLAKSAGGIIKPKSPRDIAREQDIKFRNEHKI